MGVESFLSCDEGLGCSFAGMSKKSTADKSLVTETTLFCSYEMATELSVRESFTVISAFCLLLKYITLQNFYVLLTVHLSIILDNDQLDTHLLYFTIRLL